MMSVCDNCTCDKAEGCAPAGPDRAPTSFREELTRLVNCFSKEGESNTPDFVLAEYLEDCLNAYDKAVAARDVWTIPNELPDWEHD